jgi:hypothetical protein
VSLICGFVLLSSIVQAQQTPLTPACTGADDTSKLTALISQIGSSEGTIKLQGERNASSGCVVGSLKTPPNITLDFSDRGGLKVATGQTLVITGPIIAPPTQIFHNAVSGQGTVSFAGNKSISTFYPQWWGSIPDGETDNTPGVAAALAAAESAGGGMVDFLASSSKYVITKPLFIGTSDHPVKAILRNNLTSQSSITVALGSQLIGFAQSPSTPILSYTGSGEFIIMGGGAPVENEDNRSSRLENFTIRGTYAGKGLGGSAAQKLIVLKNGFSHGTLANLNITNAAWGMYGVSDGAAIDKDLFINVAFRNPLRQAVYLEALGTSAQTGFIEMNTFINPVFRNDDSAYPTFQMKGSARGQRITGSTAFINADASFAGNDSQGTMFDFTYVVGVQFIGGEIAENKFGIVAHEFCRDINSFGVNQSQSAAPGAKYFNDIAGQAAAQLSINSLETEFHVGPGVPGRRVFIQSENSTAGDALVVGRKNNQTLGMMQVNYDSGKDQGLELMNSAANGKRWTIGDGVGTPPGSFGIYDATDGKSYINVNGSNGTTSVSKLSVGEGPPITKYLSSTASLKFSTWRGGDCQDRTIAVPGAAEGDTVTLGLPNALASISGVNWFGWVSAANTISVRGCKITAGASIDPPAAVVRAGMFQH